MTFNTCKTLTIFEGPDGGGKTSIAKTFAENSGAKYIHFPALPKVGSGLARMYVEAMMPALLGYQDVVFDRCWISEGPYGSVFREGEDRLGFAYTRMLERLAMRCGAVVIKCLPKLEVVAENYRSRKHLEMLDSVDQLVDVYNIYNRFDGTSLPTVLYDYENDLPPTMLNMGPLRTRRHDVDTKSAGNFGAKVVLVGDSCESVKNDDPLYRWPFASFSSQGCSKWLTKQLEFNGITEDQLFWINYDQIISDGDIPDGGKIIAFGASAAIKLRSYGFDNFVLVNHPQYQKRFCTNSTYDLISHIKWRL